jgi:hypothetical protein
MPLTDGLALKFERVTRALANNVGIDSVEFPGSPRLALRRASILVGRRGKPVMMMAYVAFAPLPCLPVFPWRLIIH